MLLLLFSIHTTMLHALIGAPIKTKTYKELASALYVPSGWVSFKKILSEHVELLSDYRKLKSVDITLDLASHAYISEEFEVSKKYSKVLGKFFQTGKYIFILFQYFSYNSTNK